MQLTPSAVATIYPLDPPAAAIRALIAYDSGRGNQIVAANRLLSVPSTSFPNGAPNLVRGDRTYLPRSCGSLSARRTPETEAGRTARISEHAIPPQPVLHHLERPPPARAWRQGRVVVGFRAGDVAGVVQASFAPADRARLKPE
jgi:hypothetical protein